MATGKSKSIDDIDEIAEMFEAMAALGISSKGLKTLEEMKSRVRTIIGQSSKPPSWNAGQAFFVLSKAHDEDVKKRRVLLNLYTETQKTLSKLDSTIYNILEQTIGNVKGKMEKKQTELKGKEYFVLVAGETGSGKSSLINLILGEDLLPYSVLSTTSTICELKFGEERKIVAHYKDKDPETGLQTKIIRLKQCHQGESSEEGYLRQIAPYVHVKGDREKGSKFKKIELFWPHDLLKRGIVIIDSPGVGESDIMDEIVTQYLPKAFAFLYVINSANAGGVQKDRLEKLLEEVRRVTLARQGELPTKCALFVCNKWDQVPEKEAKDVKNHVILKLQRCWKDLDPESQVIYMSSQKAGIAQDLGIITEDFSNLMKGLERMVLKSIGDSLEIHWKWLDHLLSRVVYQAKAFVMNASRDRGKVDEQMRGIINRLKSIEEKQSEVVLDLHQWLKKTVNGTFHELRTYLSSEEVKARFTSWTLDEVPRSEDNWVVTRNQITKVLSRRFQEFIEQWEEDNKVFANARESLVKHFQTRYNYVEGQLRNLQSAITADKKDVPENLTELSDSDFSLGEKVLIGVTSPIWLPLGIVAGLVIGVPVLGIKALKSKLEDRKKLQTYKKDKCTFMRETSALYLEDVIEEKSLKPFVKEQMKEAEVCLQQIQARLPELIEADKMLCNQLRDETRTQEEITERYQPILDQASLLRGRLAVFGFEEVRATDIKTTDLTWSENSSSHIGRGAFADVYIGEMKRNGNLYKVALKVYKEVLDVKNACRCMAEVQILRKLSHPHIVKFYGTSLHRQRRTVRIMLVLERCIGNLKNHIFDNQELIPAKSGRREVIRNVCRWIKEITDALAYIHEQRIVHRDLKLENVLLSEKHSVRVSDVGISKEAVEITGTIAGSPVYIAPEVFQSQLYDSKADIYSLGIILWEVWYGEQAFARIGGVTLQQFFGLVQSGARPESLQEYGQPPWEKLMRQCWEANPQKRPSAKFCLDKFSGFVEQFYQYAPRAIKSAK